MKTKLFAILSTAMVLSGLSCESLTWRTPVATAIGCTAGAGLGAIYDEQMRKKENEDRRKDIFSIFKKRKEHNQGKIVGLGAGCLAGLGVGLYLDLMHDDMEESFGARGIELEKIPDANGDTRELKVKMDGDISFATGSAQLTGDARTNVDTLREALEKYPETQVKIWGHTDGTGSRSINNQLSMQRAQQVASNLDIPTSRVVEMRGWANDKPLPGTNPAGDVRANR
ncbi:MAG: OmpA family protein, partial [Leptospiraceae bacterium]|nr:OmpA family protein [Leptospiraceae bacterium]